MLESSNSETILVLCCKGKNNEWVTEHKPHLFLLFTGNKLISLDGVFIRNDAMLKWSVSAVQIKVIYI